MSSTSRPAPVRCVIAICLAIAASACMCFHAPWAYGLEVTSVPNLQAQATYTIDEVRTLIESLPAVTAVVEEDGPAIAQTRAAYDQLSASDRALLDTETNRAALGTTQSYGRVLELAEAGYTVLHAIDDSTTLADGLYTTSLSTNWDRGKSASKQDRDWTATSVRVESGAARVTLRVNSSTYSYVRANGQIYGRLSKSSADESLFAFPVSLNQRMTITAYSQTMATEIAYFLTVSIPDGTLPDSDLTPDDDEPSDVDPVDPGDFDAPISQVDEESGRTVVERGVFAHPEVKGYMFRMVAPVVIASDGQNMTVHAQMPSQSYIYFYVGTAEEASQKTLDEGIADGSFIAAVPEVNASGSTVSSFTFPLESLDRDTAVCLYSASNKHWVDQTICLNSVDLTWTESEESELELEAVIELLENLPARNTIVPDNEEHEATVQAARDAYDSLSRYQKTQVPANLKLLLEWDESMFDLGFNTEFLPLAVAGQAYDGAIYLSGKNGASGKSIRVSEGELPEGLELQMDDAGLWASFVGVPTTVGSTTFTVEVSNDLGECVSEDFTIHVGYAPLILTDELAQAKIGTPYQQTLAADAYPDATWSLLEGTLPPGLTLTDDGDEAGTAHIAGTPTEVGIFTFTLGCDNYANGIERREYQLEVLFRDGTSLSALKQELEDAKASNAKLTQTIEQLKSQIAQLKSQLSGEVTISAKTVSAKTVKAALNKAGNMKAAKVTLTSKVSRIKPGAFKATNVRTLVVKTTKLTKKSVKGALKGSKVKTIRVAVSKAKLAKTRKAYAKAFAKKNSGKSVNVK